MTTKAAAIMALHAQGLTTREIALQVYGEATPSRMAYVRIVRFQRKGTQSAADARYLMSKWNCDTIQEANRRNSAARYADPMRYKLYLISKRKSYRRRKLAKQLNASLTETASHRAV